MTWPAHLQPSAPATPGRRRRALTVLVGVVAVLAVAATALWWFRFRGSDLDRFYRPPFPFRDGAPGSIVKIEPVGDTDLLGSVHRIMYRSRSMQGELIAVTGWVAVPAGEAPASGRPVLALGHPSVGIADDCAPSRHPERTGLLDLANAFLQRGWVVVQSDYEGLGPPGRHPYLVGESQARSILDGVRAVESVPGARPGDRFAVYGHSQGGHAALFTAELAREVAPEHELVGVVAAAPVVDVAAFMTTTRFAGAGIALLVTAGYEAAYPDLDAEQILTLEGSDQLSKVDSKCSDLAGSIGVPADEILGLDPRTTEPWATRLAENDAAGAGGRAPLLLVHGRDDVLVPPGGTERAAAALCAAGRDVVLDVRTGDDHASVVGSTAGAALVWLTARMEGREPGSTCG